MLFALPPLTFEVQINTALSIANFDVDFVSPLCFGAWSVTSQMDLHRWKQCRLEDAMI